MRARIVKIGNSRGIRIPKPLIEGAGLEDEVDITVHDNSLIISPASHPREGWDEAFKERDQDRYGDVPVCYIGRDHYVLNKRASGRKKDLADLEALCEE